jgi:hypothetical protein
VQQARRAQWKVSLTSALRSKLGAGDEREIPLQGKAPEESAPNYLFPSTSGQHAWVSPVTYQVRGYGQLQESSVDFEENQPGQRHMSQLYPVYPGGEITSRDRPELWVAAKKSLPRRLTNGGAYTGWSRAWAIGLFARLLDGDGAWDSMTLLIEHSTGPNLFDSHPDEKGASFKSTVTSGRPLQSQSCSCKVMRAKSHCCRRCPHPGRTAPCKVSVPAAASRWT